MSLSTEILGLLFLSVIAESGGVELANNQNFLLLLLLALSGQNEPSGCGCGCGCGCNNSCGGNSCGGNCPGRNPRSFV
ncbi:MAG: hypothetical protein RR400_03210 [Clostridia bacterium]